MVRSLCLGGRFHDTGYDGPLERAPGAAGTRIEVALKGSGQGVERGGKRRIEIAVPVVGLPV